MDRKILEDIGLTPKEVDVYLALISLDAASISEIRNKANVSRKSIYEILQKLLDKGLVSYIVKDNKKQYMAATPERFIELLKEKEANLETILPWRPIAPDSVVRLPGHSMRMSIRAILSLFLKCLKISTERITATVST